MRSGPGSPRPATPGSGRKRANTPCGGATIRIYSVDWGGGGVKFPFCIIFLYQQLAKNSFFFFSKTFQNYEVLLVKAVFCWGDSYHLKKKIFFGSAMLGNHIKRGLLLLLHLF